MPTIEDLKIKLDTLLKKQTDLESIIQKNQAKREVLLKDLKDEFGIEESEIEAELTRLKTALAEEKKKLEDAVSNLEKYLKSVEEKLA